MTLYNSFYRLNVSFETGSHLYLHINELGNIQIINHQEKSKRASLRNISETIQNILKTQHDLKLLKEIKKSLILIKTGYENREKEYRASFICHFLNVPVIREIARLIFILLGYKKEQNTQDMTETIQQITVKIAEEEKASVTPSQIIENPIADDEPLTFSEPASISLAPSLPIENEDEGMKIENQLSSLGGVCIEEAEKEILTAKFVFLKKEDTLSITVQHSKRTYDFNFSLENSSLEKDVINKVRLILQLINCKNIHIVSNKKVSGDLCVENKLSIHFLQKKQQSILQVIIPNPNHNIYHAIHNISDLVQEIDIPLNDIYLADDIRRTIEAYYMIGQKPKFTFPSFSFTVPKTFQLPPIPKKISPLRIRELINKYHPGAEQLFSPFTKKLVLDSILFAYEHGTKLSTDLVDDKEALSKEINDQFISFLQYIFNHLDELDSQGNSIHAESCKSLCNDIVSIFQKCQAIKVQQVAQLFKNIYGIRGELEEYILEAWTTFKEGIFDTLLQKIAPESGGVDVHIRNNYIKELGIKYGFSPLLVEAGFNDPNPSSTKTDFYAQDKYYHLLVNHFPNFIIQIAQYINSFKSEEIEPFQQWIKNHQPRLASSYGFHSDLVPYSQDKQEELDLAERTHATRQEERELRMIPHLSLFETHQMLEILGIIQLDSSLRLDLPSQEESEIDKNQIREIRLGKITLDQRELENISFPGQKNSLFKRQEPVLVERTGGYYEYVVLINLSDDTYGFFNGTSTLCKPVNFFRKLRIRTVWDQQSIGRIESLKLG